MIYVALNFTLSVSEIDFNFNSKYIIDQNGMRNPCSQTCPLRAFS